MARDYARIMTAIWDNAEFCRLDEAAQRAYLLLVTQPDISAAGVLRMWVPRWAQMSRSSTPESLTQSLKELEANRFIVLDWTTGELLVRSFVRWDAGFNNPKRKPVIVRAGKEVRSDSIREHLRFEFRRCGLVPDGLPDGPPDGPPTPNGPRGDRQAHSLSDVDLGLPRADPGPEPFPQVESLSHALHDAHADTESLPNAPEKGVVVTQLSTEDTTTHNPQTPVPPTAAAPELTLVIDADVVTAGHVVAAWAEAFVDTGNKPVERQRGQVGREARDLLAAGNDPQRVLAAARALGTKGRSTLVTELAIQTAPQRGTAAYEPAAYGWQAMKQPTGTDGPSPLRAITGGGST